MDGFVRLIEQQYFVVDRYEIALGSEVVVPTDGPGCLVCLAGAGVVAGEGGEPVKLLAGRAVVLPVGVEPVAVRSDAGASLVRCFAPV
jgi:mannose-6-phosphate isomerase